METDKRFLNILCKPEYDADGYKEVVIHINKKPYLVKIPYQDIKSCIIAQNMIRYRLAEHIHTSPPKKRGRKRIYTDAKARRQAFIQRRRTRLAVQACA
jgi:hypothetical protein